MKFMMPFLCLGLVLSLAASSAADEVKEKSKGKGKKAPSATQRFVGKLELTDEQKEKVAAIDKEFAEQLVALNKTKTGILTPEQIQAEKDANAANKAGGKKGAEAKKAIEDALKLTDEQKTKMKEWQKSQTEFSVKVVEALKGVLTPEQMEKLPKVGGDGSKPKKKKDAQ